MGARAWPFGCLCPSPDCDEGLGLRNSLRSDSPRLWILPSTDFGTCGAATPAGAGKWRDEIAGVKAGKRTRRSRLLDVKDVAYYA